MKNFLKYCDFFDVKFHFYVGSQPTNNSVFGGIMNILFVLSCILTFLIFSLDDIKKLNPISSKSEIPGAEMRIVNLHNSKIWIPWRMVTYEEKFVDHRGILHPIVSLIEGRWNNTFGMDLKYRTLKYKLCNETSMANKSEEYKIDIPLDEIFCIEEDDIPWGGSWYGDILYYIEVNLFLCKDGINFNASDPRCTKMTDLLKHRNTSWLFEFYFPVVQFQPTNSKVPMAVIYRSYYYRLSTYANKVERIYVQENILSDDKSLFGTNSINSSYWGVDNNIYGDTYFMPDAIDPLVKSTSSRLYSLVIYMDQGYIYYTRSYKKIFSILSEIFPVLNFLLLIFKKFTKIVKLTLSKKSSSELLFENDKSINENIHKKYFNEEFNYVKKEESNEINYINIKKGGTYSKLNNIEKKESNLSNLPNSKSDSKKNIINRNSKEFNNTAEKRLSYIVLDKNELSQSRSQLNDANLLGILNINNFKRNQSSKNIINKNNLSLNISTLEGKKNKKIGILKKRKKKNLFPLYYFFMDIFINKLIKPKSFCCMDRRYFTVYNFMGHIFDISSHILLIKHFNIFKNILLNDINRGKKLTVFDFNKKININDYSIMAEIDKELRAEKYDIFTKTLLIK